MLFMDSTLGLHPRYRRLFTSARVVREAAALRRADLVHELSVNKHIVGICSMDG